MAQEGSQTESKTQGGPLGDMPSRITKRVRGGKAEETGEEMGRAG